MEVPVNIQSPSGQPRPDEFFYQVNLTPDQFALRSMLPTLSPDEIKKHLIGSPETKAVLQTINSAGTLTAILEELRGSPDLTVEKLEAFWLSTDFFPRLPVLMDKSFNLEEVLESVPVHHHKKFWKLPNLLEKLAFLSEREDKNRYDWHTFKLEHIIRHIPEEKAKQFLQLLNRNFIENEHDLYRVLHALNPQQRTMRHLLFNLPQVKNWAYTKKIIAAQKHEAHSKIMSNVAIALSLCVAFGAVGFLLGAVPGMIIGVLIGLVATAATMFIGTTQLMPSSALAVWTVAEPGPMTKH